MLNTNMKFNIGEEVLIKSSGKMGIVESRTCIEKMAASKKIEVVKTYQIKIENTPVMVTIPESNIALPLDMTEKMADKVSEVLINAHLGYNTTNRDEMVESLHNERLNIKQLGLDKF